MSFREFSIFPLSTKKLSLSFSRKILRVEGEDDVFAGAEVVVEGDVGDVSVGEGCFEVWRERKREGVEVEGKRGSELKLDRHGKKKKLAEPSLTWRRETRSLVPHERLLRRIKDVRVCGLSRKASEPEPAARWRCERGRDRHWRHRRQRLASSRQQGRRGSRAALVQRRAREARERAAKGGRAAHLCSLLRGRSGKLEGKVFVFLSSVKPNPPFFPNPSDEQKFPARSSTHKKNSNGKYRLPCCRRASIRQAKDLEREHLVSKLTKKGGRKR